MRLGLVAAFTVVLLSGCRKAEPPLAGGKQITYWIEALKDPDPKQRKTAAFKLGNVGPTDATVLPALIGALKDADAGVRCEVILALVKCAPQAKEAIPELTELQKKDSDAKVRDYAAKALEKLKEAK
jgi:HEAT repeat protein